MRRPSISRRSTALALVATAVVGGIPTAYGALAAPKAKPAIYLVGGAWESINPSADMLANKDFYLGGFGFGSGQPANQTTVPGTGQSVPGLGGRYAVGILGDPATDPEGAGAHSRALALSDKTSTIVLAQIETQGYFDAYKQGPFGENEIRKDAASCITALATGGTSTACPAELGTVALPPAANLAPAPTASQILVDSDHSHGGPDTAGVWGGVPTSYLKEVHDQTVLAIINAWKAMRPAMLTYGIAHAGVVTEAKYLPTPGPDGSQDWLLHNQFNYDANNQDMDDEIRVLQARDPESDQVLDTYVNFGAHPDVLGSGNRYVTGDYPGRVNVLLEQTYGGFGMDQVGTLGRTQPERAGCPTPNGDAVHDNICTLDEYAARVVTKVTLALAKAKPMRGDPKVAMNSYFLTDTTTNPVLAAGEFGGPAIGAPFGRAANAPWYTGTQLGTSYFVGRIGPVLITGGPGEMYPQIWQRVKDTVTSDSSSGITSDMNIGTAGDFLGYIIAPLEAYPEPARASALGGNEPPQVSTCTVDDPRGGGNPPLATYPSPVGCPDPIGNDNYFFNVSHTFGERLTCDFLRGAGDIVKGDPQKYWSSYDRCSLFANDYEAPAGLDTQFPDQPDLSAVMTHM